MSGISGSAVLVTGGSGLIGSHTVEHLLTRGVREVVLYDRYLNPENLREVRERADVSIVEADLTDLAALRKAMERVDFVVHLGGLLLLPAMRNPREALLVNINGTYDLLELALDIGVKKVVYASSVSVYGTPDTDQPISENGPFLNRTIYGAGKIAGEQFCRVLTEMRGLNYVALRYSSVYGPRQHQDGLYPRLILGALADLKAGRTPRIEGTGNEVQDFVYVEDVARANALALENPVSDTAYNIVSGVPVTVKELIETVLRIEGYPPHVEFVPRPGKELVSYRRFNGEKARRELDFAPEVGLEEGLSHLIAWAKASGYA
jgi:UDP-glucose 4-epimerase